METILHTKLHQNYLHSYNLIIPFFEVRFKKVTQIIHTITHMHFYTHTHTHTHTHTKLFQIK